MRLGLNYRSKVRGVHPEWFAGYYPLDERDKDWANCYDWSTQGNHGTYTGVKLREGMGADGTRNAPLFNETTSVIDLYSAAFVADASTTEFSVAGWCKVLDNSVWSDSTVRRILTIGATATTNTIILEKTATANTLRAAYIAGSTTSSVSPTVYESLDYHTQWFHFGMTVSALDDAMIVYLNGVQTGTTQSTLGTWSGAIATAICVIGAEDTTVANPWKGWLQHVAVWNETLSAADFAYLYKTAG